MPAPRSKQRDFGQRRKRRPFSIPEVESLVQAVEQLGFGRFVPRMILPVGPRPLLPHSVLTWALFICLSRWKNVKYHAFGDNEERTYVDLKVIPPRTARPKRLPSDTSPSVSFLHGAVPSHSLCLRCIMSPL